jgi:hypothetical protein
LLPESLNMAVAFTGVLKAAELKLDAGRYMIGMN